MFEIKIYSNIDTENSYLNRKINNTRKHKNV